MTRRDLLRTGLVAGAGLAVGPVLSIAGAPEEKPLSAPFKLNYAPHPGMFREHAGDDIVDQLKFCADEGFLAWEDNGMKGRSAQEQERQAKVMADRGIRMGIFVAQGIDWSNPTLTTGRQEFHDKFLAETKESIEVAKRINAKWVTTVLGRLDPNRPFGHQMASVIDVLRRACDLCEPTGLVMVIEPLNWRDHPGMYGATSDILYATCKAVNRPSLKILHDLYHLQVTEGNLIDNMNRCWDEIGYFQIGDNPGRAEPGSGEVNYKKVFAHIASRGFTGILGMEHGASEGGKAGERKVITAYRAVDPN
ncbi:MAG TPA: TIM barrel protein [Fimbriimonadaceae bacterium]|nr:TIM barrel protein [Fimbriimonadaceae bacterium]